MFGSWIININNDKKIELNFTDKIYSNLKENYIKHYKKLINIYLEKIDAWEFLSDYTIKENWNYLPKNYKIKQFVEYFYWGYKDIWNEIEE
jgi:hypothetical protein